MRHEEDHVVRGDISKEVGAGKFLDRECVGDDLIRQYQINQMYSLTDVEDRGSCGILYADEPRWTRRATECCLASQLLDRHPVEK